MKINIKEYFNRFSSSQKRLIAFFLVFALIGTVALIRTYALTSKNQKVFFHNSSGVQHDVGRVATEPGANFFGKTNEVWSSYQTKSTDGYLWKGPGEKIAASSSPQKLVTCFAVYDVGNLYWNNPANVTFEIAADNGGQVLESDTRTLSDGFKKKYWFGYFPHCISETLAANTEYNGMTYRLKVNRGGIRIAWVQRTIETEVDPAFTVTGLKDGDVVSGNFSVQTNHTNVDGFEKYAYYLDGNLHNEEKKPIWCFNGDNGQACNPYDSTQLSNGNHSMKIVMHYGGITAEKTINFSVNNSTTPPPPPEEPVPSTGMGPNGTHWPSNTPAYNTPATKRISSMSELNSALASANSGDVIEVAPHTYSTAMAITGGKASWTKNVLVRPPLGQRQSVVFSAKLTFASPHVTVAGFKISGAFYAQRGADYSNIARTVLSGNGSGWVRDTRGFGLYELVATEYGVGADRIQIGSANPDYPVFDTVVAGCWLKGKWRYSSGPGSADHNDTIQTHGNNGSYVKDILMVDNVFWASGDKAMQTGNTYNLVLRNNYFQDPQNSSEPIPAGQEKYGSNAIRGGGNNPRSYGNIIAGSVSSDLPWDVVHDTKASVWAAQIIDAKNNSFNPSYNPAPPPLANLDSIWN